MCYTHEPSSWITLFKKIIKKNCPPKHASAVYCSFVIFVLFFLFVVFFNCLVFILFCFLSFCFLALNICLACVINSMCNCNFLCVTYVMVAFWFMFCFILLFIIITAATNKGAGWKSASRFSVLALCWACFLLCL